MASNIAIDRQHKLDTLLGQLTGRRGEIEAMLPPDLPFDRFYATIHQALRQYPQLLDCEGKSLLNAVIKAAYDGLRVDGREAVITVDEVTFGRNTNQERKVKMARYMPMAFGIIQQILRGGEVLAMEVDVIRQNDRYVVRRGTNPDIDHIPYLEGERGSIIAAYSVATLKSGVKTFEVLDRADLAAIRGAASTQNVWNNWEGEMSKKSAARRHRKTLPLGERDIVIRDSEAEELYPQFGARDFPEPDAARTQRPTRAAIENRMGTESGVAFDLQNEDEAVIVEGQQKGGDPNKGKRQRAARKDPPKADDSGNDAQNMRGSMPGAEIPEDDSAWAAWSQDVCLKIRIATDADGVNAIARSEAKRLEAASEQRRSWIRGIIAERLTDFATEGDQ